MFSTMGELGRSALIMVGGLLTVAAAAVLWLAIINWNGPFNLEGLSIVALIVFIGFVGVCLVAYGMRKTPDD